jgi:dienelactone hydrolase
VCDRIAAAGNYVVVAPDVFRGKPWSLDNFPPQPQDNLIGWISRYSWQDKVKPDVDAVVAALQAQGVTVKGSVGWCWGASQAAHAAAAGGFAATAFLHPSMFGEERQLVRQLRCPLATFSTPGGERGVSSLGARWQLPATHNTQPRPASQLHAQHCLLACLPAALQTLVIQ